MHLPTQPLGLAIIAMTETPLSERTGALRKSAERRLRWAADAAAMSSELEIMSGKPNCSLASNLSDDSFLNEGIASFDNCSSTKQAASTLSFFMRLLLREYMHKNSGGLTEPDDFEEPAGLK